MATERTLLFIIADRLSLLVSKGEMIPRYYNPGNVFTQVHLLTTSNDLVDPALVQIMVGNAMVHVHRLWSGDDRLNMALTPLTKGRLARRAIDLARRIQPDVVRTGDRLTGFLGHAVKKSLRIPHIVSLHTQRDDGRRHIPWGAVRAMLEIEKGYARLAITHADAVIIVYDSIRPYAESNGARRIEKIHNVIAPEQNEPKTDYQLHAPPRIISVGRQLERKYPTHIIDAVKSTNAELLMIGDGTHHDALQRRVASQDLGARVRLQKSMPNAEVCQMLRDHDLFAVHTDYPEFPKTVMEAMWLGLPIVINDDQAMPVPELEGDWVLRVPNTHQGYAEGFQQLFEDDVLRENLGKRARDYAQSHFDPQSTERQQAQLYEELMKDSGSVEALVGGAR